MNWHPISFTGWSVNQILALRKTQTRRLIRLTKAGKDFKSPYGVKGDFLWVKETHAIVMKTAYWHDPSIPHRESPDGDYWAVYREGWERVQPTPWRPPMFMPRWASRITLVNEGERIERVQEITYEGMKAEGCLPKEVCGGHWGPLAQKYWIPLWDSINGKKPAGCWDANPRVRVVSFRLVEGEA